MISNKAVPLWKQKLSSELQRTIIPEKLRDNSVIISRDGHTTYKKLSNGQLIKVSNSAQILGRD